MYSLTIDFEQLLFTFAASKCNYTSNDAVMAVKVVCNEYMEVYKYIYKLIYTQLKYIENIYIYYICVCVCSGNIVKAFFVFTVSPKEKSVTMKFKHTSTCKSMWV